MFVRQKSCIESKITPSLGITHDHVRRFMIPKNAYAVATESLAQMTKNASENEAKVKQRAQSASVINMRKIQKTLAETSGRYRPKSSMTIAW